jgi:hypothetical protein
VYLAETRWGRCAARKASSRTELPTISWHWNRDVHIAVAPGIGCFKAGLEYDHGGLTLQECLIPELVVTASVESPATVRFTNLKWVGLRCKITLEGCAPGSKADVRGRPGDPASSMLAGKQAQPIKPDGTVALLVDDDEHEGKAAVVVVLDTEGRPVAKQGTVIGEN